MCLLKFGYCTDIVMLLVYTTGSEMYKTKLICFVNIFKSDIWGGMCSDGTAEMTTKHPGGDTIRSSARMWMRIMLPSSRKSCYEKEVTTKINSVLSDKTVAL